MTNNNLHSGAQCSNPDCQAPIYPYERQAVMEDGKLLCSRCLSRIERRRGTDPRQVAFQHRFRHGHAPGEDEKADPSEYVTLDITEHPDPEPNQRDLLHGGPKTPMPCQVFVKATSQICGRETFAAAEMPVEKVLAPLNYKPPAGTKAPQEAIVAVTCSAGHVTQMRESALRRLMNHG